MSANSSNGSSKGIAIMGGYGGWNIGDEAILYSLVEMLRQRGREGSIHVICANSTVQAKSDYADRGWTSIALRNPLAVLRCLRKCDLLVGGGQILNGKRPLKSLGALGALVWLNKRLGNVPAVVGVGINNIEGFARRILRMGICQADTIGCRDPESLNELREAESNCGTLTADLVFSSAIQNLRKDRANDEPGGEPVCVVAVSRSPEFGFPMLSIDAYRTLIERLKAHYPNRAIHVVGHDIRERFDAGLIDALRERAEFKDVHFRVLDDLAEAVNLYANAALIISQRMHPLIMGLVLGAQVLPVAGSSKLRSMAERLELRMLEISANGELDSAALSQTLSALHSEEPVARPEAFGDLATAAWKNIEMLQLG